MKTSFFGVNGVAGLVICVGAGGRVLHFAGDRYEPREAESHTRATLRAVWVDSPSRAWAIGDDGTTLRWDGVTWFRVPMASPESKLTCAWGYPGDGLWVGGEGYLMKHYTDAACTMIATDETIRDIWGSGPHEVFCLCSGLKLVHWNGAYVDERDLPGDPDEEWNVVAGYGPRDPVYIVGLSGFMLRWNRRVWEEIGTDTDDLILGACCTGRDDLWVVTQSGQLRHWDGRRWSTEAFSAFGALRSVCGVDGVLWCAGDGGAVVQHMPDDGGNKE